MKSEDGLLFISPETTIKNSNALALAKTKDTLTLRQRQLLVYSILITQKDGRAEFSKKEFENMFGIERYTSKWAYKDAITLFEQYIQFQEDDNTVEHKHIFESMKYNYKSGGSFTFKWLDYIIPHILDLKKDYMHMDLNILKKFTSQHSWSLYSNIKAYYGYHTIEYTKNELMEVFGVSDSKTYQKDTSLLRTKVIDVAVKEINEYTEFEISYETIKTGRAITDFKFSIYKNPVKILASDKQQTYLKDTIKEVKTNLIPKIDKLEVKKDKERAEALYKEILNLEKSTDSSAENVTQTINEISKKREKILKILSQ